MNDQPQAERTDKPVMWIPNLDGLNSAFFDKFTEMGYDVRVFEGARRVPPEGTLSGRPDSNPLPGAAATAPPQSATRPPSCSNRVPATKSNPPAETSADGPCPTSSAIRSLENTCEVRRGISCGLTLNIRTLVVNIGNPAASENGSNGKGEAP